ncbi:hypothetical protein IEQ34_008313 [Dendrobium chrysotoxum]|uniref:Cucumisin n=1 Tax=Dendrobium chrysotoxum TaxID=161865 RepID=A0AAV7GYK9_DENCH|nr:hypothetical protein IEQ34_008313 [Dendrobium chrysotoxum]
MHALYCTWWDRTPVRRLRRSGYSRRPHARALLRVVGMKTTAEAYIVYMGERLKMEAVSTPSLHKTLLNQVITSDGASERLIHCYSKSFNAFAAMLTEEEANKLSSMDEVVSVFLSQQRKLHTTRSWNFMGFPTRVPHATFESEVIVGILDTGIWPESKSFDDAGFGPPPQKWKGTCQTSNNNFTCNNKIIGARYYHFNGSIIANDILSPRDSDGHGTLVSSIAAGGLVANASVSGLAEGTARGGVPSARLAVYKVCWVENCDDANILAAFDDAIADGVDIISISIGSEQPEDYFSDSIAIGSFHAVKNGILVSASAGNSGPGKYSVENFAPWLLTVAASTIDRKFISQVKLGNGDVYQGMAVNTHSSNGALYPLIYAANAPNASAGFNGSTSRFCEQGTLDDKLCKGSVVLCDAASDGFNDGSGPQFAGAVGTIIRAEGEYDFAFQIKYPLSVLGPNDGAKVLQYYYKTSHPKANVAKSEGVFDNRAPYVASFSSRGPNPITSNLLKPDLTAPGVDILAAWSPLSLQISSLYGIMSGTSISCPHVSGSAAYVKSFNPTWSPAAIKSALITTAYIMSPKKNVEAEFAYGAGHVNPLGALKPGLVYDADETDYVKFLCGQGYTTKNLRRVTGDSSSCTSETNGTIFDLNYPTFALSINKGKPFSATFHRIVTNVGDSNSSYIATVTVPNGIEINVNPQVLSFESVLEKKSFVLTLKGETNGTLLSASLVDDASERLIHSYTRSFNAMAAMLSEEEAKKLSNMDEVVSVFPSQRRELHTTRSWDFMAFPSSAPHAAFESDVVVGMLDTGIWPESESFDDAGFGPPPHKWNGTCETAKHNFTCNNKVIGARYYHLQGNISAGNIASPRDTAGHGSHTSSTVAGRLVANASLSGLAQGTARGAVPSARLAVYKVCWDNEGCYDVDLLAGFDDAVADGVDIISISIGSSFPSAYFSDPIAIGSFHAVKNGVLVSASAGNSGPGNYSVANFAPWMLTVAASTIDRKFISQVKLGNGDVYQGMAVNTEGAKDKLYPLIYAANAPNKTGGFDGSISRFCIEGTLDRKLSRGSVLICDSLNDGSGPQLAGAVGAIMPAQGANDFAFEFKLPVSVLGVNDTAKVLLYSNKTRNPTAYVAKSEGVLDGLAPYVVSFSSRGPHPITSNLLKPDLAAPGVDILAAWSPLSTQKSSLYNIISGTSMACPHVSGSAAYVKSFNPTWSPAAIKSALITTSTSSHHLSLLQF